MMRGIVAVIAACTLCLTTSVKAQQTTIINHYLGNEPQEGQMMQYVLRNSEQHAVIINYYEPASTGDEGRLARLIADALDFYVDRSVLFDGQQLSLRTKPAVIQRDLNQIVRDAVRYYHFQEVYAFDGFSPALDQQLNALNGLVVSGGWNPELMGSSAQDRRFLFVEEQMNSLKRLLREEVGLFTGSNLMVRVDSREERLKAEQDSLLAAVRNFKTHDPLAPIEDGFSSETLNLLAGDDPFILPTYSTSDPSDFENSDLADRILILLEQQNQQVEQLQVQVEAATRQRTDDLQYLQAQVDLLRNLVIALANGESVPHNFAAEPEPRATAEIASNLPEGFDVVFRTASSALAVNDRLQLNEVIALLATRTDLRVMITGYADASGNREANLRLSQARAQMVRQYLLQSGMAEHRILINFFGDAKAEGSARDRRVEVRFISRD
jgi:outer membrane protein OmpA-like peptidoglycan-associated protein